MVEHISLLQHRRSAYAGIPDEPYAHLVSTWPRHSRHRPQMRWSCRGLFPPLARGDHPDGGRVDSWLAGRDGLAGAGRCLLFARSLVPISLAAFTSGGAERPMFA